MSEWKEFRLVDLVEADRGISYGIVQPGTFQKTGGVPILKVNNLTEKKVSIIDVSRVSIEVEKKYQKTRLKGNEILISVVGSLGHLFLVQKAQIGWNVVRAIAVLPIKDGINRNWIYYYLSSTVAQNMFIQMAMHTVQATLNLKELKEILIPIPPLETQTAIAEILSSLDDKIEVNNKINQELETLAHTLFKQWFIDFEFPNENGEPYKSSGGKMVESELGEIPKGWGVYRFKDIVKKYIDNRGKTPPIVNDGIPLVEVKHMVDVGIFPSLNTDKFLSFEVYNTFLRAHLQEGDILMSTVGTIGRLNIVPNFKVFAIAQNVLGIRFKEDLITQLYMFCLMRTKGFNNEINSRLIETVQSSIKRGDLEKIPVLIPKSILADNFEKIVKDLFNQINTTFLETTELIRLRDELLPKLISGELSLNEISNQ
jgi:type I restriction enzyme S subunit